MAQAQDSVSRRKFLGAAAVIPTAAAISSCGGDHLLDAAIGVDAQTPTPRPDGAAPGLDAGADAGMDGGAMDAGADAGPPEPTCPDHPRIDLKVDCHAVGDGVTNDTAALQMAATMLEAAGGGELIIPPGTYIVGKQDTPSGDTWSDPNRPYYDAQPMFTVRGLSCLKISGYGATLKIQPGLHYGGFNRRGEPLPKEGTRSDETAAHVGRVFEIHESDNVYIEGIEVDGSNEELVLGGGWGNEDRQSAGTGIWLNRCLAAMVVDVHTHHHALDGITILSRRLRPDRRKPHALTRVVSEYNGRQGLSWISGWGLECTDCKFNHTGRAVNRGGGVDDGLPLASKPKAGVDIEPNRESPDDMVREGLFTRCEFIDNAGAGMEAVLGDGGHSTFVDCTFWGTTTYSIYVRRPGMRFMGCNMHGTAYGVHDGNNDVDPTPVPDLATLFESCTFEDLPWTNGQVFRMNNLYTSHDEGDGATWRNCTFRTHEVFRGVAMMDPTTHEIFDGCHFIHGRAGLSANTHHSRFEGSRIVSCQFSESAAISAGDRNYKIALDDVVVEEPPPGGPPTHVDGPRIHWETTSGLTGDIPPGTYSSPS